MKRTVSSGGLLIIALRRDGGRCPFGRGRRMRSRSASRTPCAVMRLRPWRWTHPPPAAPVKPQVVFHGDRSRKRGGAHVRCLRHENRERVR
ncbi:MAG: hypothetical protein MZV70_28740 [Desulfobacterales bacterium]|nr:hypothetical protein [Desulfobacterales bacterium]